MQKEDVHLDQHRPIVRSSGGGRRAARDGSLEDDSFVPYTQGNRDFAEDHIVYGWSGKRHSLSF